MKKHGFARVAVCSPKVFIGNPQKNVEHMLPHIVENNDADVIVFPELGITGYTCGDLFKQTALLKAAEKAIYSLVDYTRDSQKLIFVGAPVCVDNELFNCAFAIQDGQIVGIIPKTNIPNYAEFYEGRWFRSATGDEPQTIFYGYNLNVAFGTDLVFRMGQMKVFAEICEDLWMPIPPSSYAAIKGANLIVNLSASNEIVGKRDYRTELVRNQSGRCVAAYAYASCGRTESTSDVVFSGHCLIAENGHILAQTEGVGSLKNPIGEESGSVSADVDIERLQSERLNLTSFGDANRLVSKQYRQIDLWWQENNSPLKREIDGRPFIPKNKDLLHKRCAEIFGIQCAGLYKRLEQIGFNDLYIGVSGGLDSTLALLVAVKVYQKAGVDLKKIHGITMPGFGTTAKTKTNANMLMTELGISQKEIDIRGICFETFKALDHKVFGLIDCKQTTLENFEEEISKVPKASLQDLTFENVQARERTKILMSHGFVLGTGDLSELALGWCTYNGDHMSMYNVNCSIPKTLVKFLVEYVTYTINKNSDLFMVLTNILNTTISPELLPPNDLGEIIQSTEDLLGPYELHDFYLANFMKNGFSPEKILYLSDHAKFSQEYSRELREKTLQTFFQRFFSQQFKRNCVPDGPKVGSVSLSPRGDWRMPSESDPAIWVNHD